MRGGEERWRDVLAEWDLFSVWKWCDVCLLTAWNDWTQCSTLVGCEELMKSTDGLYVDTEATRRNNKFFVQFTRCQDQSLFPGLPEEFLTYRHSKWPSSLGALWFTGKEVHSVWQYGSGPIRYNAVMNGRNIVWANECCWTPAQPGPI